MAGGIWHTSKVGYCLACSISPAAILVHIFHLIGMHHKIRRTSYQPIRITQVQPKASAGKTTPPQTPTVYKWSLHATVSEPREAVNGTPQHRLCTRWSDPCTTRLRSSTNTIIFTVAVHLQQPGHRGQGDINRTPGLAGREVSLGQGGEECTRLPWVPVKAAGYHPSPPHPSPPSTTTKLERSWQSVAAKADPQRTGRRGNTEDIRQNLDS